MPEVIDPGAGPKYIQATILLTPWDEVPFRIFGDPEKKRELDRLTYNEETDEEYLTLIYADSIFRDRGDEAGLFDLTHPSARVKVPPSALPCLLIEDDETGFLLAIPQEPDAASTEAAIRTMVRRLATAARDSRSAAELKVKYEALLPPRPEPPAAGPSFDGNRFMADYKPVIVTLVFLVVFLVGIPIAMALHSIPPAYVGGALLLLLVDGLVLWMAPRIRQYGLQAPLFLVYAVIGLISAAVLFGLLHSTGVFKGKIYQDEFEFGGAASIFVLVLFLGKSFEGAQKASDFGVTFYLHVGSAAGAMVAEGGKLRLQLNEPKVVDVVDGGAPVARIPSPWNGRKAGVDVTIDGYDLAAGSRTVKLRPDAVYGLVLKPKAP